MLSNSVRQLITSIKKLFVKPKTKAVKTDTGFMLGKNKLKIKKPFQ